MAEERSRHVERVLSLEQALLQVVSEQQELRGALERLRAENQSLSEHERYDVNSLRAELKRVEAERRSVASRKGGLARLPICPARAPTAPSDSQCPQRESPGFLDPAAAANSGRNRQVWGERQPGEPARRHRSDLTLRIKGRPARRAAQDRPARQGDGAAGVRDSAGKAAGCA